jgi:hypothetical protein
VIAQSADTIAPVPAPAARKAVASHALSPSGLCTTTMKFNPVLVQERILHKNLASG